MPNIDTDKKYDLLITIQSTKGAENAPETKYLQSTVLVIIAFPVQSLDQLPVGRPPYGCLIYGNGTRLFTFTYLLSHPNLVIAEDSISITINLYIMSKRDDIGYRTHACSVTWGIYWVKYWIQSGSISDISYPHWPGVLLISYTN